VSSDPDIGDSQLLTFNESVRVVDGQRAQVTELRSRTGLLISAASISTSFLASTAAKGRAGFPLEFLWAIIPFGISIGVALLILTPWPGWSFSIRPEALTAYAHEPVKRTRTLVTEALLTVSIATQRRLTVMSILFAVSALALLWSIVAWIIVIE
jgi:hypothetical protein